MRKDTEEDALFEDTGDQAADTTATYDDYLKLQASQAEDGDDDEDDAEGDDADGGDNDDADGDDDSSDDDSDDGESDDDDKDSDSDDADGDDSSDDDADGDDDKQDDKADSEADAKADDDDKAEVDLKAERAEARAEHAQQAHDALTGKYGKLVQDFKALEERVKAGATQRDDRGEDGYRSEFSETEHKEIADLRRKVEELQSSKREEPTLTAEQVILQEAHGFAQSSRYRTDAARFEEPIKAALGTALEPGARLTVALDNGDMDAARMIARDVMREAYYDAKDAEAAAVSAENLKRKEKTSRQLRRKKRDAAPSGVGTRGKSARDADAVDIDPDALTKNPALARDPAFLKKLKRAGEKLGR